jgi:hypothetical protein
MASSWGAYVFISNLIPMYILALIVTRRWGARGWPRGQGSQGPSGALA